MGKSFDKYKCPAYLKTLINTSPISTGDDGKTYILTASNVPVYNLVRLVQSGIHVCAGLKPEHLMLRIKFSSTSYEIVLQLMPQNTLDDESTSV